VANTIAMILAGGQGSRLSILSDHRAKPAVPFGGNYRIIDFVMSNVMLSDIRYVGILTQYKPYSLMTHIGMGAAWGFSGRSTVAKILPPYIGDRDSDWYAGTADAIHQNVSFINRFDVDTVLILSGDHIYHMPYGPLIEFHIRNNADLTIATQSVPREEAHRFGILKSDAKGRIEAFEEKPPGEPISDQANLGIYVFKRDILEHRLAEDVGRKESAHDFGQDIIPAMIDECGCYAFAFPHYWRDVGTLDSYWEANMECLDPASGLDLNGWAIHTNWLNTPPEFCIPTHIYDSGAVINSTVGRGSNIRGTVVNSVLFRGVEIGEGAEVRESVLMDGVRVDPGAKVHHTITDKFVRIGAGASVGEGFDALVPNQRHPDYLSSGLTVIGRNTELPEGLRIGRNCLIYPLLGHSDFRAASVSSGSTVMPGAAHPKA